MVYDEDSLVYIVPDVASEAEEPGRALVIGGG